jgi:acyl-CoA thioesterase I
MPPRDFEDTVSSTIRWLKENRIDVVLVGVQHTVRLARDANYVA